MLCLSLVDENAACPKQFLLRVEQQCVTRPSWESQWEQTLELVGGWVSWESNMMIWQPSTKSLCIGGLYRKRNTHRSLTKELPTNLHQSGNRTYTLSVAVVPVGAVMKSTSFKLLVVGSVAAGLWYTWSLSKSMHKQAAVTQVAFFVYLSACVHGGLNSISKRGQIMAEPSRADSGVSLPVWFPGFNHIVILTITQNTKNTPLYLLNSVYYKPIHLPSQSRAVNSLSWIVKHQYHPLISKNAGESLNVCVCTSVCFHWLVR